MDLVGHQSLMDEEFNVPSLRQSPVNGLAVEHHVPGRTRLRMHKRHASPHKVRSTHKELEKLPGVEKVEFNERTGSFLVYHSDHPEMFGLLTEATGALAGQFLELVVEAEEAEIAGVFMLGGILLAGVYRSLSNRVKPERKPGLVHHSEGRTRLKVHPHHSNHKHMSHLKERMMNIEGVEEVHVNPRTGSVLVHHDSKHETMHGIGEVLKEYSTELFQCVVKGENPALAGVHLFTEALMDGNGKSDSTRTLAAAAGIVAIMFVLPEFHARL